MNDHASFRDPGGRVFFRGERVFRCVNSSGQDNLNAFLSSITVKKFVKQGDIVATKTCNLADVNPPFLESFLSDDYHLIEHDKVFFSSYPCEWCPSMLFAAASLTIEIAESLLDEQMGLKDATPYNVLFEGPRPVFIDVLSIERREPGDHLWIPLAQFERAFLLPLLVNRYFGLTFNQIFLPSRDGLNPEQVYALCSPLKRLSPAFFLTSTLPTWLSSNKKAPSEVTDTPKLLANFEKARFILKQTFNRIRKLLKTTSPNGMSQVSAWTNYDVNNTYTVTEYEVKCKFIEEVIQEYSPSTVLDVGCNTGRFSIIAARSGAKVVSIDCDSAVVEKLWRAANEEHLNILTLVVNLAAPTPATGWRNKETISFLDRAKNSFETVFMLAVVHHLLITERIPLSEILSLAAGFTNNICVIEFVGTSDPMFKSLCKGRLGLYRWYDRDAFEQAANISFTILRSLHLGQSDRWLYLLKKREANA
jgi:SAM-dependent methyltransferase